MELRQLRYFCAIVESGTLTAAAESLFISEQALSISMNKLEQELGVSVLARNRAGAVPTESGKRLYREGRPILEAVDALIDSFKPPEVEEVVFAFVAESLFETHQGMTYESISRFCLDDGLVTVQPVEASNQECLDMVAQGAATLALVVGEPTSAQVESKFVRYGKQLVAMAPDHPLASADTVSFKDMEGMSVLQPPEADYTLPKLVEKCARQGVKLVFKSVPARAYFSYIASECALGFVPEGHPDIERYGLRAVPLDPQDDFAIPLYLAWRTGAAPSCGARRLADYLMRHWSCD